MWKCGAIIAVALFFAACGVAGAWTVPATGLTKCYDNTGEIVCPVPGEPFYGQNGNYPGLIHIFTDNGDTVTDQRTGLVWQKTPDGVARNWDAAVAYCTGLALGNEPDWRVPEQRELVTIGDFTRSNPSFALPLAGENSLYWSATPYVGYSGQAWYVKFLYGTSEFNAKDQTRNVRCVRGQTLPEPSPVAQGNLVSDTATGLVWAKAASAASKTWQEALAICRSQVIDRYNDWRLPDVLELRSLIAYIRVSPAIDPAVFAGIDAAFWTSTSFASHAEAAWQVNFQAGTSAGEGKTAAAGVLCLRNSDSRLPGGNPAPLVELLLQ
jgi:hypothetical protein